MPTDDIMNPRRAWMLNPGVSTLPTPTAREKYQALQAERDYLLEQQRSNARRARALTEPLRDARYDAIVAIPCEFCLAKVGEPCKNPPKYQVSKHVFHGVRERKALGWDS